MTESHAFGIDDDPETTSLGSSIDEARKKNSRVDDLILKADTGIIDVDPFQLEQMREFRDFRAEQAAIRTLRDERDAKTKKTIKWAASILVGFIGVGSAGTGYSFIAAPDQVEAEDVKEAVEVKADELELLIKGDGTKENKGIAGEVADQALKIDYLYVGQENADLQSYELAKMLSAQVIADSPKAKKVDTSALDSAEKRAKLIRKARTERAEKKENPFEH